MSFLSKIFKPKPIIADIKFKKFTDVQSTGFSSKTVGAGYAMKPDVYYISASVELGNTTTKCIITATNLNTSISYLINKTVKMTRDIRPPKEGEEVFGKTVWGIPLSKESVAEMVKSTVLESLDEAKIDMEKDLDFVVRSTGVTAGFKTTKEVGHLIKALADGCLDAGVPPSKMAPAMSCSMLPERIRDYSLLDKVMFDGAVVSVLPPKGKESVANEMEGELVTAGIKLGAKWTKVDYRNPCVSIDFGSTLAGRIVNNKEPYANTIGNFLGLAGVIPDSLIRGTGQVDKNGGAAIDLYTKDILKKADWKKAKINAERVHKLIDIKKVPMDVDRFGTVPLDPVAAKDAGTTLIGCDVGENASGLPDLMKLGEELYNNDGIATLFATIDHTTAIIVKRLLDIAFNENIIAEGSVLGITGRAGITGKKPELILEKVKDKFNDCIFVSDGLALGTSIMARCMNSMGTPKAPIGGKQGGSCILGQRVELQKK
ncbi:MAG: methanogenesis marker 14 protein [Methanobrevibacter sp.]|jgi:putative methanogenesis marker protein 14|nr:methanogenesis marker 14 protein [Candidatus Methanoflexus mossambicus]